MLEDAVTAHYRCACGHAWQTRVEGGGLPLRHPHSGECPACSSVYFRWTNAGERK